MKGDLRAEIRSELAFVLWVVLLGPAAWVAALAKEMGIAANWSVLIHHYLTAFAHFLGFSALFGFSLVWYRRYRQGGTADAHRQRDRAFFVALAGVLAIAFAIAGPSRVAALLRHVVDDAIIATVVLAVERLHHQLVTSRIQAERRELCHERERRAAAEARWCSLESRVRPHFLFNTLSSIRELMRRDLALAGAMIQRFADLLRFSLDSERHAIVPLGEEIRIVEDYLEIERMRLGRRLQWSMKIDPACAGCVVPALSILTLVENAVKHAVAPRREGGAVTIVARIEQQTLVVDVADDGPGFTAEAIPEGHGLDLLAQRLETWGTGGELRIRRGLPGAVVSLAAPCGISAGSAAARPAGTERIA